MVAAGGFASFEFILQKGVNTAQSWLAEEVCTGEESTVCQVSVDSCWHELPGCSEMNESDKLGFVLLSHYNNDCVVEDITYLDIVETVNNCDDCE